MKKKFVFVLILGLISCNASFADNVATVDLQKVVGDSARVKQLKDEYAQKIEELNRIIVNARGAVANETDPAKILQLEDKYTKEFNTKKDAIEKDYNRKLAEIEKSIRDKIVQKARKDNYDRVFAKSVVLYGGKDITDEINAN